MPEDRGIAAGADAVRVGSAKPGRDRRRSRRPPGQPRAGGEVASGPAHWTVGEDSRPGRGEQLPALVAQGLGGRRSLFTRPNRLRAAHRGGEVGRRHDGAERQLGVDRGGDVPVLEERVGAAGLRRSRRSGGSR